MQLGAYLFSPPRCSAGWPNKRGYSPPVSNSLGPGLCRILDMDFYIATQEAAVWLASLRDRLEALEEDTEEAFLQRREVVKLLVERLTISRSEAEQVKIDIMYKFRPPEPVDDADLHAAGNTLRSGDRT